jgi:2-phospho-L-lactate transferase/gluconeogenesis factor (CofD/UPF0052 family)
MLANTGELQTKDGRPMGAGYLRKELGTLDWIDIVKQSIHGTPLAARGPWHRFLDAKLTKDDPYMRTAYVLFEAARLEWGLQDAIDFWNGVMGNRYRVLPSVGSPCDLFFQVGGQRMDFNEYAYRPPGSQIADDMFIEPMMTRLDELAAVTLRDARMAIVGPGDVHFSVLFHFAVSGFRKALAEVPNLVLITNLTARPIDIPGFKLSDFLSLYDRWLPSGKPVTVLVHRGPLTVEDPLTDDVDGDAYGRFTLRRAPMASQNMSNNGQLIHDESLLAAALAPLLA